MRAYLQHRLNMLHVYARLYPLFGRRTARSLAQAWGRTFLYTLLYTKGVMA
jgi:hypothetical protein